MKKLLLLATAATLTISTIAKADIESDKEQYTKLTNEVIASVVSGEVSDVDSVISKLNELTNVGKSLAEQVSANADENGKKYLALSINGIETIKSQDLDTIEEQWHHGGAAKAAGLDPDSFDHYGAVNSANDTIIHPLTALVALQEYKKDGDAEHLEQVQGELEEVLGHLKNIK